MRPAAHFATAQIVRRLKSPSGSKVKALLDHLGGSNASAIHGIPRQNHDVDLVVDLHKDRIRQLAQALAGGLYVDDEAVSRAVREHCDATRERSSFKGT